MTPSKGSSILDEIRKVKYELAMESGNDLRQFYEDLKEWARQNPHKGQKLPSTAEKRLSERTRKEAD